MTIFQIILVVLSFVFALGIGFFFSGRTRKEHIERIVKGSSAADGFSRSDQKQASVRRAEISKKLKGNVEDEKSAKITLENKIAQAGFNNMSVGKFWALSAVSMILCAILAKLSGFSLLVVIMVGVIGLLGLPRLVLRQAARRRQQRFLEEFADALEAVVRLLKAGMPVSEAVSMISREFSGPVGEEMARIHERQKIGIPLHEVALEACRRMPLTEMKMFATGLSIQAQTGSSLSEVLTNLANVIRARFKLKRKIRALSSEAVISAMIIGSLPPLVTLGLYFANPGYIDVLFTDPFGQVLLAGAVTWMCIGMLIMKTMINFKI